MASTLFFKTNEIHQRLTYLYHPLCVRWNSSETKWEYSIKGKRKLFPNLFITIFLTGSMCYAVSSVIILSLIYDPGLFSLTQILLQILILGAFPLVVMIEIFLLLYGKEIVAVVNWGITLVTRLGLTEPIIKNTSFFSAFQKEISKISNRNHKVDWFASYKLLLNFSYFFVSCSSCWFDIRK